MAESSRLRDRLGARGDELGAEDRAHAGQGLDDLRLRMTAERLTGPPGAPATAQGAHISISSQGAPESRTATPWEPLKARPHKPHPALPGRLTTYGATL